MCGCSKEGGRDRGLEALLWPFAWCGAGGPCGGMRLALARAAETAGASGADEWTALGQALGGVVPRSTVAAAAR